MIMDEPTAPLGPFERSRLYDLIGRLKDNHVSIIFISHDLDEVLRLCDRVSVMRDGQLVRPRDRRRLGQGQPGPDDAGRHPDPSAPRARRGGD